MKQLIITGLLSGLISSAFALSGTYNFCPEIGMTGKVGSSLPAGCHFGAANNQLNWRGATEIYSKKAQIITVKNEGTETNYITVQYPTMSSNGYCESASRLHYNVIAGQTVQITVPGCQDTLADSYHIINLLRFNAKGTLWFPSDSKVMPNPGLTVLSDQAQS